MKLRWSFRAANDRGPQRESRIPGESPAKSTYRKIGAFFVFMSENLSFLEKDILSSLYCIQKVR